MKMNLFEKAISFSGLAKDKRFTTYVQWIDFVDINGRPGTVFRGAEIHNEWGDIDIQYAKAVLVRGAFGPYKKRYPAVQIMVLQKSGFLSKTQIFSEITAGWEQDVGNKVISLLYRLSNERKEGALEADRSAPGEPITLNCGEKLAAVSSMFPDKTPTEIVELALDLLERTLLSTE